jgi:signal transduction histidine kinase
VVGERIVVGSEDPGWFQARPAASVRDFFELVDQSVDAVEDATRALETTGAALSGGSVAHHAGDVRERLRHARSGDWQPIEFHLRDLGSSYARSGLAFSAWFRIANRFRDPIVACAIARYAAEPERLTAVLQVVGEYVERSLSIIAADYYAVKEQLEREVEARHAAEQRRAGESLARSAARLEILSRTAHEFAAASGHSDRLLELVARRLGEIIGEGCAVRLISPDGQWLEPSTSFYHDDPERRELARHVLATERQRIGEGLAGRVAATGKPVRIPVVDPERFLAATAPAFRSMLAQLGVASALALPLRSRDRTIGAISLLRTRPGNPYTIEDQHLAQDLADRAGLAIDNAVLVATLEHRVAERTAALEASYRELEAFSYTVSHDLRTPLRAIDGFSRILLIDHGDKLDPGAQHYLQRILAGTRRMAALIDDLLELARITRAPVHREVLDLSGLAGDVVAELHKREPARTVAVDIAPGLSVHADPRLVRIALDNLLGNAWKFTARRDGAQIWFGGETPTFHVRDNGAGFDMAFVDKLFAPFQRLHAVKDYDGTGIGLATVHRIVSHHGGRIWAEAEVGQGATFFFTLGDEA